MIRYITAAVVLFCAGLFCLAQAQIPQTGAGLPGPGGGGAFTPSCTPSTNFLARTSGLTNPQKTNYDNLICGLETDSLGCVTGSEMLGLYVLAAPNSATSLLNLCSASFPLVSHGTITFSANNGYTGDRSTGYLDTGIAANDAFFFTGSFFNSTSMGAYIVSNRTTSGSDAALGATDGTDYAYLQPLILSGTLKTFGDVYGVTFINGGATTAKGNFIATRTSTVQVDIYLNSSLTPIATSGADSINGPPTQSWYIGALNNTGTAMNFSGDQIAFAFFGHGLSAANAKKVADRLNTFATALGINAY